MRIAGMMACLGLVSGVAYADAPLPAGDYLGSCDDCTATAVADVGVMLGCMCGANPRSRVLASIYLLGDACPHGVSFVDDRLLCASELNEIEAQAAGLPEVAANGEAAHGQAVHGDSVIPARSEAELVRRGSSTAAEPRAPSSEEMARAQSRLATLGAAPPEPAFQPMAPPPEPLPAGATVAQYNGSSSSPIRLAPVDCTVAPDGTVTCMCPTEGLQLAPSADRLVGSPSAWTCGCTVKAGLVCVAEP